MSCEIFTNNPPWGTAAKATFALAIFLSYVPQQVTIVKRQTTEGISPYFLLLMNLGSSFAFANILVLTRPVIACCMSSIGAYDCFGSLLVTAQLFAGFLGPTILLLLSIRFRESGPTGDAIVRSARLVGLVNFVSWVLVIAVTDPVQAKTLATFMGLASLSVGFVQYVPQLFTTYKLKHTGSLSVMTMLLQIPGGYLWCLSIAIQRGSHWSTWLPLFAAASFQLILLIMSLYYSSKGSVSLANRLTTPPLPHITSVGHDTPRDQESAINEETPLLRE